MNTRKILLTLAILGSLLLTGCSGKLAPNTEMKGNTTIPTTVIPETQDSLEVLRGEMAGTSCTFAVAYIGDSYGQGEQDFDVLLNDLAPELCRQWPFVAEIPTEDIVDLGWGEIYCIIPADPEATVRICGAEENTDGYWEYSHVLYEKAGGAPVLLVCNRNEYYPDTQVIITSAGVETYWCPQLDKYYRPAPTTKESGESLFLDISSYQELFAQKYWNIAGWDGFRLPVKEDLVGKAWGFEGTALYDDYVTTYLLAFDEGTAFIRWNDGIENHEIHDIPWELTYVDAYAVLTLDLGTFEGVRSYNLLYDEEYGWLYTVVDLSSGKVTAGQEIPVRFLEARSLDAPAPVEMAGTWSRILWEADGYVEEDTSGTCTITIRGETEDELTISFTDREFPESNYQNKPLYVKQGVIYEGCGNGLWLAEVDHVGPWDTTYTVTLLADGTLMLQNYFLLDGAPTVSYEWFERIG